MEVGMRLFENGSEINLSENKWRIVAFGCYADNGNSPEIVIFSLLNVGLTRLYD